MAIPFLSDISAQNAAFGGTITINPNGNAILNVNGTADSFIEKDSGNHLYIANNVGDKDIKFRVKDNTTNVIALNLDGSEGGNATFAGKINAKGGASISGFTAATINAYSATVSSNLFSALRIIDNTAASSYWDIGATGNASTLLNFYHNGSTSPKVSFTHTGGATFAGNVSTGSITAGSDTNEKDFKVYGNDTGELLQWLGAHSKLRINHDTDDAGLEIFTVASAQPTSHQVKIGRDSGQYLGIRVDDGRSYFIHRQDESSSGDNHHQTNQIWTDGGGTHTWNWDIANSSGGSPSNKMQLNSSGSLSLAGNVNITGSLYLDGGNNTYITESSDGVLDFYGDGIRLFTIKQSGTQNEVVVNDVSGDIDFRVEANNDQHAFFVEAEAKGTVGIGVSDPDARLEVIGSTSDDQSYNLRLRSADDQELMYVRNDGIVKVSHNYLYVDNTAGIYSNGAIRARAGVTNDGGTLGLGGNGQVDNLVLTSNTSATFAGSITGKDSGIIIDSISGPYGRIHGTSSIFLGGSSTSNVQLSAQLIPDADSARSLGNSGRYWSNAYIDQITTTGDVNVGGHVLPNTDSTKNLGSDAKRWAAAYVDSLSATLTATISGDLRIQSDLSVLNKAQTAYIDVATRNTSGSEVVYDLGNIGDVHTEGRVRIQGGTDNGSQLNLFCDSSGDAHLSAYTFSINTGANNSRTQSLKIDHNKIATFSGRVDLQKDLRIRGNDASGNLGVVRFLSDGNNQLIIDTGNNGNNQTVIDGSGNATFAGDVTLSSGTPYLLIEAKNSNSFVDPYLQFTTWNVASGASSGKIALTNGSFNSNDMAFFTETNNSVTEKLRITSAGNVGINETNPLQKLHVVGTQIRLDNNSGGGGGYYLHDNSGTFRFALWDNGDNTRLFADGNGSTAAITIDSNNATFAGYVGIKTPSSFTANASADELVVGSGSGNQGITIYSGDSSSGSIYFADDLDEEGAGDSPAGNRDGVIQYSHNNNEFNFKTGGNQQALELKHTGATFSGDVSIASGALSITSDGSNAVTFTESGSGDFTIDVPDDLRLDFGGSDLVLKAGGTEFSRITFNNPGLNISTSQSNANIYLSPNGTGNVYAITDTLIVTSDEGEAAKFLLRADQGDDNGDDWYITNETSNVLTFKNDISGSSLQYFGITPSSSASSSLATFAGNVNAGSYQVGGTTRIDSAGRFFPTSINGTGKISFLNGSSAQGARVSSLYAGTTYANDGSAAGTVDVLNGYRVQGTTVIDSNRNFIGNGNLFLRSYNTSGQGIFFRDGFEHGDGNEYNLSITILNDGDSSADALEINAYDGIYFNTGSNSQNIRAKIDSTGLATFYNDVTVLGNLIVDGTTTTLNTQTVEVEDNILQLNTTQGTSGNPDTPTATTSGISVYRGNGVTQASFIFDDGDDTWDLTNNLVVAGNITTPGNIILSGAANEIIKSNGSIRLNIDSDNNQGDRVFIVSHHSNTELFRVDEGGHGTFQGNVKVGNALIDSNSTTSATTTTTVGSVAVATYGAAFFDYVAFKGSNIRAGTIAACNDGTNVSFAETSTTDLGDTSDVTFAVDISGGNMRLRATTASSTWTIKALIRGI